MKLKTEVIKKVSLYKLGNCAFFLLFFFKKIIEIKFLFSYINLCLEDKKRKAKDTVRQTYWQYYFNILFFIIIIFFLEQILDQTS